MRNIMPVQSKNNYWKSRAVTWLLKESKATDIEAYMKRQANKLLCETGQNEPPFNPVRIGLLRKIKGINDAKIDNISELVPVQGGFIIRINPEVVTESSKHNGRKNHQALRSRRFTIAHEIGHTYFYETTSRSPSRPYGDLGSVSEERLCDIFATELLMPSQRFLDDAQVLIKKIGSRVKTILELGRLYRLTLQPIVLRLYEVGILDKEHHVTIKWNYKTNPSKPQNRNLKLRIEWSYPSSYPFIPRLISANADSIFDRASHDKQLIFEETDIKIGGVNGEHFVEAISIPGIRSPSSINEANNNPVLSILYLADPTKLL